MLARKVTVAVTVVALFGTVGLTSSDVFAQLPGVLPGIEIPQGPREWEPEGFEPKLKANPADEQARLNALSYYNGKGDVEHLRRHTLEMVKHHPANMYIFFRNSGAFYDNPTYRMEVIAALEQRLQQTIVQDVRHGGYWNLAMIAKQGAIPRFVDEQSRQRWLTRNDLPADTVFQKEINHELADKAEAAFKLAFQTAGNDGFKIGFTSRLFAELLRDLNRNEEALKVIEAALPHADKASKPELVVLYGRALKTAGRIAEAKKVFRGVRAIDDEWNDGPGGATRQAETELGLIALEKGNAAKAAEHLLVSLRGNRDTTNSFGQDGLPIGFHLAEKLLAAGQHKAVVQYSHTLLGPNEENWKHSPEVRDLLQRALKAA